MVVESRILFMFMRALKSRGLNFFHKLKRVGIHNIVSAYAIGFLIRPTEFLKTFHKDSLNVLVGVPTRLFAIDCLARPIAGLPSISGSLEQQNKIYDTSEPLNIIHPKHLDFSTPKISGTAHLVVMGQVFVDTNSGKVLIQNLFGPKTKTVEIYLGHTYGSFTTSGISMFSRIKKPKLLQGLYYSIQIREDQNYYHFLLLLAPAILRVYKFGSNNNLNIIFLLPKLAPKFVREFLNLLSANTITVTKKFAKIEKAIVTTIYSGDAPHPLDVKCLNQFSLDIAKHKSDDICNLKHMGIKLTKWIYISRRNQSRFTALDKTIEEMLDKIGFLVLMPENCSIEEQMCLFSSARLVVGNHGAGLANLAFCKSGTRIIELTVAEIQINDWMKNLSHILDLDYRYIEITNSADILKFKKTVLAEMSNLEHV